MKRFAAAMGIASLFAIGLHAQSATTQTEVKQKTREKTKVEVKDGKDVTVAGCIAEAAEGGFILTNDVGHFKYSLVTEDNLKKYIGRQVEVKGVATDRGDAKVKVEKEVATKGEVDGAKADDSKRKEKTEMQGDMPLHYLAVRSVKKLSDVCQ